MISKPSRWGFWRDPCLHLLLLVLALVGYKLLSLEIVSRAYLDCQWCLSTRAVSHEIKLVLVLLALHLLSCMVRWRSVRIVFRSLVILAIAITALDLIVMHEFWVRLTASQFLEFAGEFSAMRGYLQQQLADVWVLLATCTVALLVLLILFRYLRDDRPSLPPLFLYLMIAAGMVGCELVQTREYHDAYLQNSLQVFFTRQTSSTPYSREFVKTVAPQPDNGRTCGRANAQKTDIILLVFESLSMYHSALFSGINDWMPEFDAVSKTGVRFPNFYANGVTSEQGLVALLTGEPPIPKGANARTLFEQFRNPVQTMPRMLRSEGYNTVFLTTGNLGFVGKGKWLKDIGFDVIEGHDAPFYQGMKRYQFDAASDDALYGRALRQLQARGSDAPTFMTLETVTTHLPNIDPASGTHSQELTYRYADRQLGDFVRKLQSMGFFDNGTLVITADHRAMVPMGLKEQALYGDRGYARVPLAILGKGLDSREELASFSQTDLLPSLRHAVAEGTHCVGANQGVFLPKAIHVPQCIYTNRSYNTNHVFVHCGANNFSIALNGDQTQFSQLVDAQTQPTELLQELHRLRLGKGFR
ncbi:MAG: LTA synthase family protein [Pseudomonadota bacterium]